MEEEKLSVYLIGSHCAGKTTLLANLMRNPEFTGLGFKDQEEIARKWFTKMGYTKDSFEDKDLYLRLQKILMEEQYQEEAEEIEKYQGRYRRFIWDRGFLDCLGYITRFIGANQAEECSKISHVKEMMDRWRKGISTLVFVVKPEEMFYETDELRRGNSYQELVEIHRTIISLLEQHDINYEVVNCIDIVERMNFVIKKMKQKWPWLSECC